MASIGTDPNGHRRILFMAGDGTRKTIRLGKATAKQAEAYKGKIEDLVTAGITGRMDDATARWLAAADDVTHARLAAVGLVKAREAGGSAIGPFIDQFLEGRADLKPHTVLNMKQVRRWMVKHFGEKRDILTITPGEAEDFRLFMVRGKLGENTIRRHIGRCRQLFKAAAKRRGAFQVNPFDGMKTTVRSDKSRLFFVTREMTGKVIEACPDAEWRLLVALSRFGGLRCPSEHLALKWSDVDWDKSRIRIPSPKTEHHEGKDCRHIPIFPELEKPLLEALTQAAEGAVYVISRYRDKYTNLRTQFERIIRKAGLTPWAKPWQNLRSTRETELAETYPIHVVCAWIGNSRAVAQEHYLQVTDEHFKSGAEKPKEKAAQNPAQYASAQARTATSNEGENPVFDGDTALCEVVRSGQYPRQGPNNIGNPHGKHHTSATGGTQSGTLSTDRDLLRLEGAWPGLTDQQRRRILAIANLAS